MILLKKQLVFKNKKGTTLPYAYVVPFNLEYKFPLKFTNFAADHYFVYIESVINKYKVCYFTNFDRTDLMI